MAFGKLGAMGRGMGHLGALGSVVEPLPSYTFSKATGVSAVGVIANGGSGHTVGELIPISGGTSTTTAILKVSTVSGGVITGFTIWGGGVYTTAPSNPVTVGDASVNLTFASSGASSVVNKTVYQQNNAAIRWNSIDPRQNIGSSGYFGNVNYIGVHATFETVVTGSAVDFRILGFTTGFDVLIGSPSGPGYVWRELSPSAAFSTDASGAGYLLSLRWATSKARLIKIVGYNLGLGGCQVGGTDTLSAPGYTRPPLAFFFGDSYTFGTGATTTSQNWANVLAAAKGWECLQDGIGGAGWTSSTTSLPNTRVTNDMALRTNAPSKIICAMGYNDAGGNMATLSSQFATAIATMQADFPSATIQVLGPWTPLGETANLATVKTTLQTACSSAGVTFVDISDIITAGNSSIYTGGDNVHPNQAGHTYLGQQISGRVS
jgi:lysophospholipase L1-like esterase